MNSDQEQKPAIDQSITTGEIHAHNVAIGPHATAIYTTGKTQDAFKEIEAATEKLPEGAEKTVAQTAVKSLKTEAQKGDQASEETVSKWVKFLADVAPDVWQVAINSFINPIYGLSTAFTKIGERAKAEIQSKSGNK